jgi:hypothetical protein
LKFMKFFPALLVTSLILIFSGSAFAVNPECNPTQIIRALFSHAHDSAVELELNTPAIDDLKNGVSGTAVHAMLTTEDGTLAPFLEETPAPEWFEEWIKSAHPHARSHSDILWDEIPITIKKRLIEDLAAIRKQDYFQDRLIHGLYTKKKIKVRFAKPVEFLGATYAAGNYTLDVSKMLMSKVEFISKPAMKDFDGVEIHFRGNQSAGAMSNDAWTLLDGAGIKRPHQHVHIVAALDLESLEADPIEIAAISEFYRRSNLATEMYSIMREGGARIRKNEAEGIMYFNSLTPENLELVVQYFESLADGHDASIGSSLKQAYVGLRGSDSYDQEGLWGLEVRAIGANDDPKKVKTLLDALQHQMDQPSYGVSKERLTNWLKNQPEGTHLSSSMKTAYYNQDWNTLKAELPGHLKIQFDGFWGKIHQRSMGFQVEENRALKMFVYDWSKDPLFHGNPEALAKIEKAQLEALKDFKKSKSKSPYHLDTIKNFLQNSGIYDAVNASIGIH